MSALLENVETIRSEQLPGWISRDNLFEERSTADQFMLPDEGISLEDLEKKLISQALEKTNNNKTQAAKLLNISYDTLRYQVKKHSLE